MTHHEHESKGVLQTAPLVDPVCGMTVSPSGEHHLKHDGKEYRFCSGTCLAKFEERPNHYLAPLEVPTEGATSGATYTCPMHSEVRQEEPGSCPKCGMVLGPVEFDESD
jgi:Cu+-exporting ATPase